MAKRTTPEIAAREILEARASAAARVTAPGTASDLPPTKFDRLSIERRVLGHVTDEVDFTPLGARNTLAALTHALLSDPNTIDPPSPLPRLERVDGEERRGAAELSLVEAAELVDEHLGSLVDAGLLKRRADGSYEVTKAGQTELRS